MRITLRAETGSIGSEDTFPRVYHDRTLIVIGIACAMVVAVEGKRRLPLLQAGDEAAEASARPAWQWVVLGATAIFVVWLPLAAWTASITARWTEDDSTGAANRPTMAFAMLSCVALATAAFAGGFVIGKARSGTKALREAVLSGLIAALVAVVASWITLGFNVSSIAALAIAAAFSALGGKVGQPRSPARRPVGPPGRRARNPIVAGKR